MTAQQLLGLRLAEAVRLLAGAPYRVISYKTPRGEQAGPVERVVQARCQGDAWELMVCGFPEPPEHKG